MNAKPERPLIALRFEGPTFERHTLPANALRELAHFQETFVEVAKDVWRARHPDRARLPNGFAALMEPRMSSMREGSVEIAYERPIDDERADDAAEDTGAAHIASEARDLLLDALEQGAAGAICPDLSFEIIQRLSKLGATLDDEDQIVAHHAERRPVKLDLPARAAFRKATATPAGGERPSATIGDLRALVDDIFGDVPDEVWDASPPLELRDVQDGGRWAP